MDMIDKIIYGCFIALTGVALGYAWAWFALNP